MKIKSINCFDIKENMYTIDANGNVFSLSRNKQMKTQIINDRKGYQQEVLTLVKKDGSRSSFRVHRLVLASFNPAENMEELQVNHINGNSLDNHLSNLEWVTNGENQLHAFKIGLQKGGEQHPRSILKEREVEKIIDMINKGIPSPKIAEEFGVTVMTIASIRNGQNWKQVTRDKIINNPFQNREYSLEDIKKIKELIETTVLSNKKIAIEVFGRYDTKYSTLIWKIKNGKAYKGL